MKQILVFDQAIRLGMFVTKYVGPFDSTYEARQWYDNAKKTFALPLPNVTLCTIMDKDS